jgi:K+-sensing histidine kinase KdpD
MPVSARGIRVTVSHRDDLEFAVADADLLAKALKQLLENAYKYSEAGSAVQIYTYMTTDHVVITVTNRGPAIPQSEKERVFDRFYRSAAVQNEPSGTGLGLSVAKTLVEAQRGRIWVESNEGVGNTFYVSLPARYHYEQR